MGETRVRPGTGCERGGRGDRASAVQARAGGGATRALWGAARNSLCPPTPPRHTQRDSSATRFPCGRRRPPRGVTDQGARLHVCRSAGGAAPGRGPPPPAGPRPSAPRRPRRPAPCTYRRREPRGGRKGRGQEQGGEQEGAASGHLQGERGGLRRAHRGAARTPPPCRAGGARRARRRGPGKERGARAPRSGHGRAEEGGASRCDPRGSRYLAWRWVSGRRRPAGCRRVRRLVWSGPARGAHSMARGLGTAGRARAAAGLPRRVAPAASAARSIYAALRSPRAASRARFPPPSPSPEKGGSDRRDSERHGGPCGGPALGAGEGRQGRRRGPQSPPRERPIALSGDPVSPQAERVPQICPGRPAAQGWPDPHPHPYYQGPWSSGA